MADNLLVFGVRNLVINAVLTDPASGAMTFGADIAVTGLQQANLTMDQELIEARGDDILQGVASIPATPKLDIAVARISFKAMAVLIGGTFTCAVATDKFEFVGTETGSYFKAAFTAYTDNNETFGVVILKMKANQISNPFQDKTFAVKNFQATAVPPKDTTTNKLLTMTWTK